MTTEALGAALSGLRVAQRGIDVTANNIANASTPGYTKKILSQSSVIAGDRGVGVRYNEVTRYVDQYLQRDYRVQLGVDSYLDTRQSYLGKIVSVHGATESQSNVGARIGALYNELVALSNMPDSRAAQGGVVSQAVNMAKAMNTFSDQLLATRNELQSVLKGEVERLNADLKTVADYNRKVQALENTGRSGADIADLRDEVIKRIASQLDITYYQDGDGTMVIQTRNGQFLAGTEARELSTDASVLTPSTLYPDSLGGLILHDTTGNVDLAPLSVGGRIGALLEMRDNDIPTYTAQLDELAHKVMMRLDQQNLTLFTDYNGTIPPSDPAAYAGLASRIKVNDAIVNDPGLLQQGTSGPAVNAGSNEVIRRVLDYAFGRVKDASGTLNEAFVTTQLGANRKISFNIVSDPHVSLEEFARAMLNAQAQDFNIAKSDFDTEHQYMQEVEKRLLDTSSVNTDEEMASMIELQKSYAASAKMIGTLDELFRELLNAF